MNILSKINILIIRIKESSLVRASGIYTIASFINASIPFLLLPFLTKYLSSADFGFVAMFTTVTSLMMPFISVNMEGAIARTYYKNRSGMGEYIGNCLAISLISSLLISSLIFLFHKTIYKLTGIKEIWLYFVVLQCFFQFISLILLTLFQVRMKPWFYGIILVIQSSFNLGISILLVKGFRMNYEGRIIGQISGVILVGLISFLFLIAKREINFRINLKLMKHALKYGGGLIPHALGASMIIYTNRFFLLNMISIDETGLYSVSSQIASIIGFFTLSFNNAYIPWLFEKLNLNDYKVKLKIVNLTYVYFVALLIGALMFYFISPLIFNLFINKNFYISQKYTLWLIIGFVFQGMYYMITNFISYSEKTYYQAIITFTVGLINIPSNYFFIKIFGPVGAAIAFGFAYCLLFLFTWVFSNRVYNMPWFYLLHKTKNIVTT
jgi:O-antigen/teichoic acid export membrane protein